MEIYSQIANINDPEHPLTLSQLKVVTPEQITVNQSTKIITVRFTPTIPHCSMATLIGLSLKVRLGRCVPATWRVDVMIKEGTHVSAQQVNKQLADKERVRAAQENAHLRGVVEKCIEVVR